MVEILIAEDSPTQALLLENILRKSGYRVTAAAPTGRKALEEIKKHRPDMVITDIQMPEMDGYELCERIKSDPDLAQLPVMLLTSLSAPQDIVRGLECGADNFVMKPYDESFLRSRIEFTLANRELLKTAPPGAGLPVFFAGQKYVIKSDRVQILNLLLSTYETAVEQNAVLRKTHEDLKAAQAQLIEAEKMQSVGRLAAGVAHEVKNPLAILEMGLGFLSSQPGAAGNDTAVIVGEMKEAVRRANFVITELMELAAPKASRMRTTDLNSVVEESLGVMNQRQSKIRVVTEFAGDLPACQIDADKVSQALANIFANARDAMRDDGTLTVRTFPKTLESDEVAYDAGGRSGVRFRAGEMVVVVEVDDTGTGIAPENLDKIFEPFFTTKPTGKGMGLGLTVARKLIDSQCGQIDIRNRPEGGVSVTVLFKCLGTAASGTMEKGNAGTGHE